MRLETYFNIPGLHALISDASIDFTPSDFDSPLTPSQQAYLLEKYGIGIPRVFWRKQVHGDGILTVLGSAASAKDYPDADAYITGEKKLPIAIRTADCIPVFIADPSKRAIGLAHAGWQGTAKSIAAKTVEKMGRQYGSRPEDLKIVLGPGIRACCYQVGEEFKRFFAQHVRLRDGFLYADLISANRQQLLKAGVAEPNIHDSGICTCCDKGYFSFRRDGAKAGRMISLMMMD